MPVLVDDEEMTKQIRNQRDDCDSSRWDEVWEGMLYIPPIRDNEHQDIAAGMGSSLFMSIQKAGLGFVRFGVVISDRDTNWSDNYRFPDVVVYLITNPAINHGSHWTGGPDFLVEVLSPGERAYAKFDFYAQVRTREILLVFRNPWRLELHRLNGDVFELIARNEFGDETVLTCQSIPFSFHIKPSDTRPAIEMRHLEDGRTWEA